MKKILFVLFTAGFMIHAKAQLVVNLQLPPVALILKSQLWNMTLVNTSGQTMTVKVDITLSDVTNNVTVMTASSAQFVLTQGARQMQAGDFMPIVYNVVNGNYNINNDPNGFLPVGHFDVCYQFIKLVHLANEILTEECETVEIEPLSPPMLVFPEDEAVIETPRPLFHWIPPAPANLFNNLSYALRMVEVTGIQTPTDAIQQNIALFAEQNIIAPSIIYPAGLPALDTGKLYAWQVTANNNGSFIARSDVWVFRLGTFGSEGQQYVSGESYAKLKLEGGSGYFLCKGALKFHYDNHFNDDTVTVSIHRMNDQQTTVFIDSNYLLQPGQNFKQLDIRNMDGFTNNRFYLLELINSRNERWVGKFLYKREE